MKIGVIMGGISSEREISLKSGEQVIKNLNKDKYEKIIPIIINSQKEVIEKVKEIDFAFIALHGRFGEDGTIQGTLETMGIPYSGCGVLCSAISMNKCLTKRLVKSIGIETASWITVKSLEDINYKKIQEIGYPVFIKPNNGGSSVATFLIRNESEIENAVKEALKYDKEVMIEKYIDGEEITSFILNGEVFPTVVIKANMGEFFDYKSKYEENGANEEVSFLDKELQKSINKISKSIWDVLGCKSYARIDMIISNNIPYFLEINTLPGMTTSSLIPKSARARGYNFSELLDMIIEYSLMEELKRVIFSNIDFNDNEPIYMQIENYIKKMIENNMVVNNGKLPATRELSKILGVSRNSIITAYENLEDQGIVYTVKGKGTFISPNKSKDKNGWKINWEEKVNTYGKTSYDLDIIKHEIPWEKNLISFKSISPDGELFDMEEFKKAFLNSISIEGHKILNYGYAKGYKPLMEYLLNYMKTKGVDIEGKDIIIVNGFTEGLEMILTAYTNPSDKIICENPTHNTAIKIMRVHELDVVGVSMNEEGIDTKELEEKLSKGDIKLGYLIPSYHNPTGIVMKGEKRYTVYNLFKKYNVPIIEDGFNEELLYNSTHVSPIAALDNGGSGVIYIGSFSKILFPGIRVGWILADKKVIDILESVKRCKNIHTSFLDQGILYEYLRSGAFDKQIKKVRKVYKEKYEFALECINRYVKPTFVWGEGGLHIYIGIEGINSRQLLNGCYENGVIFTPGDIFSVDNISNNTLRLGLSRLTLNEIEEGIKIIGSIKNELKK